jgi:hypothetical protein
MMLSKRSGIYCGVAFFMLAAYWALPGSGTIGHAMDVAQLLEASDLVVVGRVSSINEGGTTTINLPGGSLLGRKFLAVLIVDEILKGTTAMSNLTIEFAVSDTPAGIQGIPLGQYGIFFLQQGQSTFRVSDPFHSFLPAEPGGKALDGPPIERVATKLGEALTDARSTQLDVSSTLDSLRLIQGKFVIEILRQALHDSSGQLRLRIASTLVSRGDIAAMDLVEAALLRPGDLPEYLRSDLAGSLAGLKDPRSIPALKRLLKTKDQQITWAVAIALRQIGSTEALEPLSELLNDSNETTRYRAVAGMGEITKQDEWTPAFNEFRSREAYYISYWRQWASANLSSP